MYIIERDKIGNKVKFFRLPKWWINGSMETVGKKELRNG